MEHHNSCLNTLAIIEYFRHIGGVPEDLLKGLDQELAGIQDPVDFLSDPNNWVSADCVAKMFANAREITGDKLVAHQIGFDSVINKKLGYVQRIIVQAFGTPRQAFKKVKAINDKFNRTKQIELIHLKRGRALLRLYWDPDLNLNEDFCLFNKGIYSAMFTVWGIKPGEVEETKCQFRGDECCEYSVRWRDLSVGQRLAFFLRGRSNVLAEAVSELDHDKKLLQQKYNEVQGLSIQLQKRVDQLVTIHDASGAILSGMPFKEIFPIILKHFVSSIGFSRGMIMLVDEEAECLRFVHGVGEFSEYLELIEDYVIPMTRRQNILVRTALSGRPIIVSDARKLNLNPDNLIIRNFQPKAFVILPLIAQGRVVGLLAADHTGESESVQMPDRDFLSGFANQVAMALENVRMLDRIRDGSLQTIQALASAVEAKDPYTRGHSERVAHMSSQLALRLGLSEEQANRIEDMCLLHDIGKIGISNIILNKAGPLSGDEYQLIQGHPSIGEKIIRPLKLEGEETAIVRHHHERYDGQGYPDGLAADEIPLPARIACVCDAFDAMTFDRPYRPAFRIEEAIEQLEVGAGRQFDPVVTAVFIDMLRERATNNLITNRRTELAQSTGR